MRRFLIFVGISVAIILALGWATRFFMIKHTKSFSPEEEVTLNRDDLTIKVFYNRPYKKGRVIFGPLVPYDKVWRTGANEATSFETNKALTIGSKTLPPGKYSLWTVPNKEKWTIIFNSEYGQWGINSQGEANRNPKLDVLKAEAVSLQQENVTEQFTIDLRQAAEHIELRFLWDHTQVTLPISYP